MLLCFVKLFVLTHWKECDTFFGMNISHEQKLAFAREIARERAKEWYGKHREAVLEAQKKRRLERGAPTEKERAQSRIRSNRYYARKKAARKEVAV